VTPNPKELDRWRDAGRIAGRARELGASLAVPGASLRSIADRVEAFVRESGAQPAFPVNLSRNFEAAHYTPSATDTTTLLAGDLLKVDVGAHLDGAIADTATTVEVGGTHRHDHLIRAAHDALEAGIERVRSGVAVDDISRAIESAIHALGLKPVRDLTGHSIETYLLHAGKSIPNASGMSGGHLEAGEIIAIEPFATNGVGSIENGPFGNIARFRADPGGRDPELEGWFERFKTLPFATRWLAGEADRARFARVRRHLQTYPVFLERGRGLVAQAEHTVLVLDDGAEVLTRG
jgi:methionyl aminopeptidase